MMVDRAASNASRVCPTKTGRLLAGHQQSLHISYHDDFRQSFVHDTTGQRMCSPIAAEVKIANIPIPKEINYIWFGREFEDFDQSGIQTCAEKNPDYKIYLWLDDFSMLEAKGDHSLPRILPGLFSETVVRELVHHIDTGSRIDITTMKIALKDCIFLQMRYHMFIKAYRRNFRHEIPTVHKFREFVRSTGYDNIAIRYMSTDLYEPLISEVDNAGMKSTLGRFLRWALFERFRGNYGAASNLLRILLLQKHPGIYIDHDDLAPSFGQLAGFRYTRSADHLPTNSFLAHALGHPFLPLLRDRILSNYDALSDHDGILRHISMQRPTDPDDLEHPFILDTYARSGPGAFIEVLRDVIEKIPQIEIRKGYLNGVLVRPRAVKHWALGQNP